MAVTRTGTVVVGLESLRVLLGLDEQHEVVSLHEGVGRDLQPAFVVVGPLMPEQGGRGGGAASPPYRRRHPSGFRATGTVLVDELLGAPLPARSPMLIRRRQSRMVDEVLRDPYALRTWAFVSYVHVEAMVKTLPGAAVC